MTKTKSQKARAAAARKSGTVKGPHTTQNHKSKSRQIQPDGRRKKWYLGIDTSWGSLHAGSAEKRGRSAAMASQAPIQPITSDELIGTVAGSNGSFSCNRYAVQAGSATTFPWLATMAAGFQEYRVRKMRFYTKPMGTAFDPASVRGQVVLSFTTNAALGKMGSIRQAEGLIPHDTVQVAKSAEISLEPSDWLFVRLDTPPTGGDIKTYDYGSLFVCVEGSPDTSDILQLCAEYTVEFRNPVIPDDTAATPDLPPNYSCSVLEDTTNISMVNGVPQVAPLATETMNGLSLVNLAGIVAVHKGRYRVRWASYMSSSAGQLGTRAANLYINGVGQANRNGGVYSAAAVTWAAVEQGEMLVDLNAGDLLEIRNIAAFASGTCTVQSTLQVSLC